MERGVKDGNTSANGMPTLPQHTAGRPAAARTRWISVTTELLPLVPVTATIGAGQK